MAMSKRTQLASAKRKLRRIEEDEPAFRIRIAGMPDGEQRKAIAWFQDVLERQRARVKELEGDLTRS